MNINFINSVLQMSVEQLESNLEKRVFTENEEKLFKKAKDLIDQGFEMNSNDSGQKVLEASVMYYVIENKKRQNK